MEREMTEPSVVTEQAPEAACFAPPAPAGNKTKVIKGYHPETPAGLVDWSGYAFQPIWSKVPVQSMEAATEAKLARIAGIEDNPHPYYAETRRRIHIIATRNLCAERIPEMPLTKFSADQLVGVTAYINALTKPLGYDYMPVLRREADLLIPRQIEYVYDVGEMLRSFSIWRKNCRSLHDPLLIVGLFLLFFRKALEINYYRPFRYDLVVDAIMSWQSEAEIRNAVNNIVHRGIE